MTQSLNNIFQNIAERQGIKAGSAQWRLGGNHPFSGQTGGHSCYGWRHDHKLEDVSPLDRMLYVRSVIANYGMRPCYYLNAPKRESGYRIGGRPVGYDKGSVDMDPNDQFNGERIVQGVPVSGPDLQHFWLDPLLAIIDYHDAHPDEDIRVEIHTGAMVPAKDVARSMISFLIDSMSGMLRYHGKYLGGGRAAARILDTYVEVALTRKGLIHHDDAVAVGGWLEDYGLPAMENAPGVQEAKAGSGGCNWYQNCGWMLPPLWNAVKVTNGELNVRIELVMERIAQWMLDIDEIAGGAARWERLDITPQMRAGVNGKALPTLLGADVQKSHIYGQWSFSLWSVRAADVARRVHPSAKAEAFFERVKKAAFGEAGNSVDNKAWLVDAENDWLV